MNEQAEALKRRTKQFALDVIALVRTLPTGEPAWTVGGQLTRLGNVSGRELSIGVPGAILADFVAKIALVEEEADESGFWLEIAERSAFRQRQRRSAAQGGRRIDGDLRALHDDRVDDRSIVNNIASINNHQSAIRCRTAARSTAAPRR